MIHWDDPMPDGTNRHTEITEEELLAKYRDRYHKFADMKGCRRLTDKEIIDDIITIHWGWKD